ncbi:SPOR domain-containing protein [Fervidibacillus albus]
MLKSGYKVQFEAFANKSNAERLVDEINKKGCHIYCKRKENI